MALVIKLRDREVLQIGTMHVRVRCSGYGKVELELYGPREVEVQRRGLIVEPRESPLLTPYMRPIPNWGER